ncbi:MAG: N-acetyltransferase [Treponema sp.]|nr:N-acetyltransferase [Treponema sp.]
MHKDYTIRMEQPCDFWTVENLTRESFWNVYRPGCTEHYVLHCYRDNPDFIPELSLVMEKDGRIIGHVMYSKAKLSIEEGGSLPIWTFGPISIHPDYKRQGYGIRLLTSSMDKAKEMGIGFLCMEGNICFYRNAGFDLAYKKNIHYHSEPKDSEVPYFLAKELIPGFLKDRLNGVSCTYCPPEGYFVADENPEGFELFDAQFPKKEKLVLPGQLF